MGNSNTRRDPALPADGVNAILVKRARYFIPGSCGLFVGSLFFSDTMISIILIGTVVGLMHFGVIWRFLSGASDMRGISSTIIIISSVLISMGWRIDVDIVDRLILTLQYNCVVFFVVFSLVSITRKRILTLGKDS